MNLQDLCTNCLLGTIKNGTCSYCGKSVQDHAERQVNTLPERYLLGNRYYIGKIIGKGGFGITYLAWDCHQQKRVIVKELYPNRDVYRAAGGVTVMPVKGQEDYFYKCKQRFREEAQLLYSFRHEPSILDVYQIVEENNTVYYSMEYLSGFDLKTYMEQMGVLEWNQLSEYVKSVLRTLHILHSKGLIHRDISPDNIFLISQTEAKLIDFGSVRCYNNDQGLTALLKLVYAPPEQYFTNGKQGPWTDIYSLSVTMYFALSGKQPQKAPARSRKDELVPIDVLCPGLPKNVANAIMDGMILDVNKRTQSAFAMAQQLFPGEDIFKKKRSLAAAGQHHVSSHQNNKINDSQNRHTQAPRIERYVRCINGRYQGRRFSVPGNSGITFGRDVQCQVVYPPDSRGISRRHCSLWCDAQGKLFIKDEKSTYGTTLSGYRLEPGKWYQVEARSIISFAGENYYVE